MSKIMYVVKMENEGWWGDKSYTKIGIAINTEDKKIYIEHLAGAAMPAGVVILPFIIRELRQELKEFLKDYKRVQEFKVEYSTGMSGREDYTLKTRSVTEAGFEVTQKRASLHVSCNGKLNEGFDSMYIGDYLEIMDEMFEQLKVDERQTVRNIIEDLSVRSWKRIGKKRFKELRIQKVWKVKEATDEGWKGPGEII